MELKDFKDKHKGEEMIVICNGSGLKNIPFAFLESRPSFAINFFPYWVPWIKPTYWAATDSKCFEMVDHETLEGTPKFIPLWATMDKKDPNVQYLYSTYAANSPDIIYYQFMESIPGFVYPTRGPKDGRGLRYGTTAIACSHLAHYMGASVVLLVGFDCTLGLVKYEGKGLSEIPHFYDHRNHKGEYASSWDTQFGHFEKWARERGTRIFNLSIPTMSKHLPQNKLDEWWRPE